MWRSVGIDSDLVFSGPYDTPGLGLWGRSVNGVFAKNFSPLRGESRSVSRPPHVVSRGTIGFPLRPPILGQFRGKAKTLTPNISSPEGVKGALPVPKDARRGSLRKFQTSGVWAPPLIFWGIFPEISDFFGGQKADCRSSVKNLTRP